MKSLRELLVYGPGPSSSHTIGPSRIANDFLVSIKGRKVSKIEITLYGSLAFTGKGHFTDAIIKKVFAEYPCEVHFAYTYEGLAHPNTVKCKAFFAEEEEPLETTYESIGGGAFKKAGEEYSPVDIYPFDSFNQMKDEMLMLGTNDIYSLIEKYEDKGILEYAEMLVKKSFKTIEESFQKEGELPGTLRVKAVAKKVLHAAEEAEKNHLGKTTMRMAAYAYATAEANARGEIVVTAPTCGSAGVVPAVLYWCHKQKKYSIKAISKAYLAGALVCNFIKQNASIAGAVHGCQAEVGSAASFAAASLCYLFGLSIHQIEYAAEVAMEHFLGLTCDPVDGYVQIPCIERNAIASTHAYAAFLYAKNIEPLRKNRVDFDTVIRAMKETGSMLNTNLKETSLGGLAKYVC